MRQVLAVTVITLILGCAGQVGPRQPATETRDEFKQKVMGKTEAEVLESVGRPDRTGENDSFKSWTYSRRTTDPVTGNTDASALLMIDKKTGRVVSIDY